MDLEKFIELLKKIDFTKNSVLQVSKTIGVNEKTIRKYLNLYNIPYNKKSIVLNDRKRNEFGQYSINLNQNKISNKPIKNNKNIKNNAQNISDLTIVDPHKMWGHK